MSFINPFFLIALGAAAVPVLFHLVRRANAKKVPFSSLMFLQATPKEVVRRRRLRDLLLLAMRCTLFALLALVFARPFLPAETLPFVPQREDRSVVLLVDRSMSMRVGDRLARAQQEVLDRLGAAEGDDEFALIAFSDAAEIVTPFSSDLTLHQTALGRIEADYRTTDFYEPLRRAAELLGEARHEQRTVVLLSDFQQGGWSGALDNWKLAAGVEFVPISVTDDEPANAYVEALAVRTERTGGDVVVRFDADVVAPQSAGVETARLVVDGAEVERQALGDRATHRLSAEEQAEREGVFQGELTLDDDALSADNQHFFTYAVAPRPALLAISDNTRGASDAFFLRTAFDLGDDARYSFSEGGRGRLTPGSLRPYDAVFLTAPSGLTERQTTALRDFAERGGTLIVSAGPEANLQALSMLLETLGVGTAGDVVNARREQGTDAIIGDVELRHPVFEIFAGLGRGAILQPRFRRYLRLSTDSAATVLARFDTGDPLLVERDLGAGRVLAYTSTFSTAWTDFPLDESYVPFVYQLARYAAERRADRRQYTVGEVVALPGQAGEVWEVRTPEGDVYPAEVDAQGTAFFPSTDVPGHYVAARGTQRFPFSVNVDPRESDLTARDAEEVYAAVAAPSQDAPATPEEAALAVEDEEARQKLWRVLLLVVLALFAAETFLANRSTKRRDGPPTADRRPPRSRKQPAAVGRQRSTVP